MAVSRIVPLVLAGLCLAAPLRAQQPPVVRQGEQGITVQFIDTDLRAAVQALGAFLDRPIMFGAVEGRRVTFTSPVPLSRADIPGLLRTLLEDQGYVMEEAEGAYRVRSVEAARPAPPPPVAAAPTGALASAGGRELYVIRLSHARAADVAATVNALYGNAGALGETRLRRGTLGSSLNADRQAAYEQVQPGGVPAPVEGAARTGDFTEDVVIVPDFRTNSLLVRATAADYALVRAAVEQVDVRPLQVLIEATVAYVRRDFTLQWGLRAAVGDVEIEGSDNTTVGGRTEGGGLADVVIRALNLGGIDLDLVLEAGENRSRVVILDRPLVLAANNEEAEIVVGEQRPFVQVQRSTDGGVLDEIVQYKDVGTTLRVLPTISGDGYVQLQVVQEVNSAAGSAAGLDAPIISTRSVETQLLVRDGHTAVLGGLTGMQRDRGSGGVPFLSRLPLIGGIFGRKDINDNDFELFIFITPHVIYSDDDMDDAADDVRRNGGRAGRAARRLRPLIETPPAADTVVVPAVPAPETAP